MFVADKPSSAHLEIYTEVANDLIDHELLLCAYQIGFHGQFEKPMLTESLEPSLGILKVKKRLRNRDAFFCFCLYKMSMNDTYWDL